MHSRFLQSDCHFDNGAGRTERQWVRLGQVGDAQNSPVDVVRARNRGRHSVWAHLSLFT